MVNTICVKDWKLHRRCWFIRRGYDINRILSAGEKGGKAVVLFLTFQYFPDFISESSACTCECSVATPWTACSEPGCSVHGISQAGTLEWDAICSSSNPGIKPTSPVAPALLMTDQRNTLRRKDMKEVGQDRGNS